ncbi:MAG: TetR family transcriptional regulator [Actinomycetota bacterium]
MTTHLEPVPVRRGRPARFSAAAIVDAAVEAIAEVGVDALTMRQLADRLDTTAATLYRHVDGQDGLIDAAIDRIMGEVAEPPLPTTDDEIGAWLMDASRSYRAVMLRYPGSADHLLLRGPTGEHGLRRMAIVCQVLARLGMTPREVAWAYDWLLTTVSTYTAKEDRLARVGGGASVAATLHARGARVSDPSFGAVLAEFTGDMDAAFERTTRSIVDVLTGGRWPTESD